MEKLELGTFFNMKFIGSTALCKLKRLQAHLHEAQDQHAFRILLTEPHRII